MPFHRLFRGRASVGIKPCDERHVKAMSSKVFIHFIAHFKGFGTDARSDDGVKVFWLYSVGGFQQFYVLLHDAQSCSFPSSMDSRHDMFSLVP